MELALPTDLMNIVLNYCTKISPLRLISKRWANTGAHVLLRKVIRAMRLEAAKLLESFVQLDENPTLISKRIPNDQRQAFLQDSVRAIQDLDRELDVVIRVLDYKRQLVGNVVLLPDAIHKNHVVALCDPHAEILTMFGARALLSSIAFAEQKLTGALDKGEQVLPDFLAATHELNPRHVRLARVYAPPMHNPLYNFYPERDQEPGDAPAAAPAAAAPAPVAFRMPPAYQHVNHMIHPAGAYQWGGAPPDVVRVRLDGDAPRYRMPVLRRNDAVDPAAGDIVPPAALETRARPIPRAAAAATHVRPNHALGAAELRARYDNIGVARLRPTPPPREDARATNADHVAAAAIETPQNYWVFSRYRRDNRDGVAEYECCTAFDSTQSNQALLCLDDAFAAANTREPPDRPVMMIHQISTGRLKYIYPN